MKEKILNSDRTLSYQLSQLLTMEDLNGVAGAGNVTYVTGTGTYHGQFDGSGEITWDM
jgi:hypothetical protein